MSDWYTGNSSSGTSVKTRRERVEALMNEIRDLERLDHIPSKEEVKRLADKQAELMEEQGACFHVYEVELLFSHYMRACKHCLQIDRTYDHWKSTIKP